eukprot:scaffold23831_cov180-Amphora_coffeaeformis.AAC.2
MDKKRCATSEASMVSGKRARDDVADTETLRIAPIRLFKTATRDNDTGKQRNKTQDAQANEFCMTLRQVLGFDGNQPDASIEWLVISNYLIDPQYLLEEVPELLSIGRVVVFYGYEDHPLTGWKQAAGDSIDFCCLRPSDPPGPTNPTGYQTPYGVHHTKMFLIGFSNKNVRVVVHTANLRYSDIHLKSQGLYLQDFPLKSDEVKKETCVFENTLLDYLDTYRYTEPRVWGKGEELDFLRGVIRRYDYSSANVVLLPCTPGLHHLDAKELRGHLKVRQAIAQYTEPYPATDPGRPVVCQFSSMGSVSEKYLRELQSSMDTRRARQPLSTTKDLSPIQIKLVYPTVNEIRTSIEGYRGGGTVPGRLKNVNKPFLQPLFRKWSPNPGTAQNALWSGNHVPHIKSYFQLSKDEDFMEYFILGSQNLSMAAWGNLQNHARFGTRRLFIRHWELGVFLSPQTLGCEKLAPWYPDVVDLVHDTVTVPLPYCETPELYAASDAPWAVDVQYSEPDAFGRHSVQG